ncbi:MAG: serine--tRNA ligase [Bifidobacteriaceae bacterium]|jgi:seryl-tRNA synthetase|nr:serine--tRNA ligase [Bifidobacteriaceae bacterium]
MIDIKFVRQNPSKVKQSQIFRGQNVDIIDELLQADDNRRVVIAEYENLKAEQNQLGKTIPKTSNANKPQLLAKLKNLSLQIQQTKTRVDENQNAYLKLARSIDNIIEGAPRGDETNFIVLEEIGQIPNFTALGINIKDHLDIGQKLNILDTQRGTKVSGTRFYFLKGLGAQLELALQRLAIDTAINAGLIPIITPTLVLPDIMESTGFLGEHSAEVYKLSEPDKAYLTGTSEVAIAGYHKDEVLDLKSQTISYAGISTCYRREAGSYGKDTRGIIRVHQFNKVEMFTYCRPDIAEKEHLKILDIEKSILNKMEIPYRVIDIAAGDLGSSAARKFDCEAYLPSQKRYLELTSTSNCTTYQARRLNIKYINNNGKNQFAATLNGTLATTRWIVAILENHQQADGSVKIPTALQPYMNDLKFIK